MSSYEGSPISAVRYPQHTPAARARSGDSLGFSAPTRASRSLRTGPRTPSGPEQLRTCETLTDATIPRARHETPKSSSPNSRRRPTHETACPSRSSSFVLRYTSATHLPSRLASALVRYPRRVGWESSVVRSSSDETGTEDRTSSALLSPTAAPQAARPPREATATRTQAQRGPRASPFPLCTSNVPADTARSKMRSAWSPAPDGSRPVRTTLSATTVQTRGGIVTGRWGRSGKRASDAS